MNKTPPKRPTLADFMPAVVPAPQATMQQEAIFNLQTIVTNAQQVLDTVKHLPYQNEQRPLWNELRFQAARTLESMQNVVSLSGRIERGED